MQKILKLFIPFLILPTLSAFNQQNTPVRQTISLNAGWVTVANDTNKEAYNGFEMSDFSTNNWVSVDVPHNWDKYEGYLRKVHGNRHGYTWYRKEFSFTKNEANKRYFLFFEGVSSYATVWLNGVKVGYHAGGRTTFTIDITNAIEFNKPNLLAVRADHPANIRDLPWVCGGCSEEWGFSEGSQPMGIFRPVSLIITNDVRIEPFGVHIWNDTSVSEKEANLHIETELKNYSETSRKLTLISYMLDTSGKKVAETKTMFQIDPGKTIFIKGVSLTLKNATLWSPENPYLYTLHSKLVENKKVIDETDTKYGIRWISWPINKKNTTGQFLINGKPVFINGIGEYEHRFGNSHAFTDEQIKTRIEQIKAAGFNAFRDAHQPHNIRYQELCDSIGLLWWTQMSAHIWFDNPDFKENFKILLREWVKERRNNPSNIIWGLQNESSLPEEFARECVQIIHEMDPTTSSQRIVTTCNGGVGTDWNVIQNWSGTYGGKPENYDKELPKDLLNGEYGAWRSIDLHSEGPFNINGILSENRMTQLLEMKIRKAESVKDSVCGQFLWVLSSHDNPGRIQSGEGLRDIDRIGPANYKGLFTPWGEPLDAFYMYRANYVPKETSPMVYIVSHTWPNRWTEPGVKDSITVYSNCDEVELFNGINGISLGRLKNRGRGIPFIWEKADIRYNILYAKGYIGGKEAAQDMVVLYHLPEYKNTMSVRNTTQVVSTIAKPGYNYLYRVNCGGNNYTDENGNLWMADRHQISDTTWGSKSWTDQFKGLPPFYGSQRRTFDTIEGTNDQKLFQTFRYGLNELSFNFPVPDGEYLVELYFTEPWYGTGGGMNCQGWRLFDVAINNQVVINNFDIWKEAGHDNAVKKEFIVFVKGGILRVHFPKVTSGQALISAISIACRDNSVKAATASPGDITDLRINGSSDIKWETEKWLDIGDLQFTDKNTRFYELPSLLYGAEWIKTPSVIEGSNNMGTFKVNQSSDVFLAMPSGIIKLPDWASSFTETPLSLKTDDGKKYQLYSKRISKDMTVKLGGMENNSGYTVFVVPVSSLDAPSDQRAVKEYSSDAALIKGTNGIKKTENDRHFIEITSNLSEEIDWQINVGLASTYGIHFKYQNNTGSPIMVEIVVESQNGIEMQKDTIKLDPSADKWPTIKTHTSTAINAGSYWVRLRVSNANGLKVQRLEIQ